MKKTCIAGVVIMMLGLAACGAEELNEPAGVAVEYSPDDNGLYVNWEKVKRADEYDVKVEGTTELTDTVTDTSAVIYGVPEGTDVVVKVRAVNKTKNGTEHSEWAKESYSVPVYLGEIANMSADLDGALLSVVWDNAKGADKYEVTDGTDTIEVTEPGVVLMTSEGNAYNISARACRTAGGNDYYSEWQSISYETPVVDMTQVSYVTALFYDYDRLINWAKSKGYTVDSGEDGELTVVDVHKKDPENSGFWNTAFRAAGSALGAYLGGYVVGAADTVTEDFSSARNAFVTIMSNNSVKEYAEGVKEGAKTNAKVSALQYGLQAIYMDTDMHYVFYYSDTRKSAICAEAVMMKSGREKLLENEFGNLTADENGVYNVSATLFNRNFKIEPYTVTKEGYSYWDILIYK